jgi:hypothetical protein
MARLLPGTEPIVAAFACQPKLSAQQRAGAASGYKHVIAIPCVFLERLSGMAVV